MSAYDLQTHGATVVPVVSDEELKKLQSRMWKCMDDFPEYKRQGRDVQRVLGGFGALGNPSSFHMKQIRRLRYYVKKYVGFPLFRDYVNSLLGADGDDVRLELLFDRLCVRCESFGTVSAENWHRDIYDAAKFGLPPLPRSLPGGKMDEIFGGWLNLSDVDQYFVGILGSHHGDAAERAQEKAGGFATLTEQEIDDQQVNERLAMQKNARYGHTLRTNDKGHIVVPPGHQLIFFQRLLHAVASGKQPKAPQLRMFVGFRLTTMKAPMFADTFESVVENFAVPRIPSGQIPPMYSNNHYAQFSKPNSHFRTWAESTFKRTCLYDRPGGYSTPGSRNNLDMHANKNRYMPSLSVMGLSDDMEPYSVSDRKTMQPELLFWDEIDDD